MAGTRAGGRKAAATNKQRYGLNFYEQIGRKGGLLSRGGGFANNRELAVEAGRKGGKASHRGKQLFKEAYASTPAAKPIIQDNHIVPEPIVHSTALGRRYTICPEGCLGRFYNRSAYDEHYTEKHLND